MAKFAKVASLFTLALGAAPDCSKEKCPQECTCVEQHCAKHVSDCLANPKCSAAKACIDQCGCNDEACAKSCGMKALSADVIALGMCAKKNCPVTKLSLGFPGFGHKCKGTADPKGPFPACYEGTKGAAGLKEDVLVKLNSYASSKGTMDLKGTGALGLSCQGKPFTKSGQKISPSISDCLPSYVTVKEVLYCSDDDTVTVTVKDTNVPLPLKAVLKKVTCPSMTVANMTTVVV